MGDVKLRQLQRACSLALEHYVPIAQETCARTGKYEAIPLSDADKSELLQWLKQENVAQQAYLKARSELLEYLIGILNVAD